MILRISHLLTLRPIFLPQPLITVTPCKICPPRCLTDPIVTPRPLSGSVANFSPKKALSKKFKEAKILESRLKLCRYAFAIAVQPGMAGMPRRERVVALKALAHANKDMPVQLMVEHSMLFAQELLKTTGGQWMCCRCDLGVEDAVWRIIS